MRYEGMPNTSNPFLPLLQEAGLIYGVNLHYMELDRDRRAVVQKHDIENKVADVSIYISRNAKVRSIWSPKIWSKAITVRKDLLPIFYDLLMMNDEVRKPIYAYGFTHFRFQMISKAQWYITDEGVQLISKYFLATEGAYL